jgi:hypothetical protein
MKRQPGGRPSRREFLIATATVCHFVREASSGIPITVSVGTLTPAEFAELRAEDQILVERSTRTLVERYGRGWMVRERDRLRDELSFFAGVP